MTRRQRIVLGSATVLIVLLVLAVGLVAAVTQTAFGRDQIRRVVVPVVAQRIQGKLYVGRVGGGLFGDLTIDSLAIRGPDDSLFLSTGRLSVRYDLRDLLDRRVVLHGLRVDNARLTLRQYENGDWNWKRIFRQGSPGAPTGERGFGDFVVLDSAVVRNASLTLALSWRPSTWLSGSARDSAIRFEMARPDRDIRRSAGGYVRTWHWSDVNATLLSGRIANPDSAGQLFRLADVSFSESDPPFVFRNVRGEVRILGDSAWLDAPRWDLPGSTGSARGKITWGSDLPVRYAIRVVGDSVSLSDVSWVYPTLPTSGGGRTVLDIVSEPSDPRIVDYALSGMDVRSTRSHLTGSMTFAAGGRILGVKNVQLAGSPLNFDLLRTLNGKPFPYDWQGDITGTVRARGGPLNHFVVDDARFGFADANVAGAVARGTGRGELDILFPAFTAFRGFDVNVATLDLRTLQYLNKEFPRVNGTVSGSATLDSSWLDVRFRNGDLTHRDGDAPESRFTGNGRVTWGEKFLAYDLTMQAAPISFTTLARSYARLPLRGSFTGPIRVLGTSENLQVVTTLTGPGGEIAYDGRVDAYPPGYAVRGSGSVKGLDVRAMLDNAAMPGSDLSGSYTLDITGDSLPAFTGSASFALAASSIDSARIESSAARLRFGNGLAYVDTLMLRTAAGRINASGSLATATGRTGALGFTLVLDSLTDINRYLRLPREAALRGSGTLSGTLSGAPGSLALRGELDGRDLARGTTRAERASGTLNLAEFPRSPTGTAVLSLDTVSLGGITLPGATTTVRVLDANNAIFAAAVTGRGRLRGAAAGAVAWRGDRTSVRVDSARLTSDSTNSYRLGAPATVLTDARGLSVDSAIFTHTSGARVAVRDVRLAGDSIRASVRTDSLGLGLFELFTTALADARGTLVANADVAGTLQRPRFAGSVRITDGAATLVSAGTRLERINADVALVGDTIRVRTLSAETRGERRGTASVDGTVAFDRYDNPVFALAARARNFRAVDRRGLASLDLSTTTPLSLTGPYRSALVQGGIRVDRGTVYIPELITKRVVDLNDPELYDIVDTTMAQNRDLLPEAPSEFARGLRLQNVAVTVGDDVWLRSAEANIKLGGSLNVTLGESARTGERSQLALEGELSAVRGTYRLDVVPLVQPTFEVESGTLRFFGSAELDPALDIKAINTVRQSRQSVTRQDVRIRATIGGTLSAPNLTLSSADNLPLSQSDLLSYLITGQPAFALDNNNLAYAAQLATIAVRSAGSVLSSAIPRNVFDVVELQVASAGTVGGPTTSAGGAALAGSALSSVLNARAVFGKQLNSRLFLNLSTGLCAETFRRNLGLRFEYRFSPTYTALFGVEPGTSDVACVRAGAVQTLQQTPPQFGLDFLRSWRF